MLLWGSSSLLVSWCLAHFGLLGLNAEPPLPSPFLNKLGVFICLAAMAAYCSVDTNADGDGDFGDGQEPLLDDDNVEAMHEVANENIIRIHRDGTHNRKVSPPSPSQSSSPSPPLSITYISVL